MRKPWALGLASLGVGLTLLGNPSPAAARTLDEIIKSGTIRVGVNPTLPPLGKFDEQNQIVGFDVDYATAIAQMLGAKLEVVQVGSPDRVPFVASGKIDFAMGGMTRTPERAKVIDFSMPVHTEFFGVLTKEDKNFKDPKDLDSPNVTLIQVRGTTPLKFIETNLKNAKVTLLDNYPDAVRALAQGRGDAMIDVIDYLGEYMSKYDTKWKILPEPLDLDYDCLGTAKNAAGLKDWLNIAVFELNRSGKTGAIYKKWFGIEMPHPVPANPAF
jgi:polar amino acid transport system substrate-binding protein